MTITDAWISPCPFLNHGSFFYMFSPCPISQVSDRAAVAVRWYPARVNPSQIGDMSLAKILWNFSILLAGNWHIMHFPATFIKFITCHFSFTGNSINCLWSTLQNAATNDGDFLVLWSASSRMCSRPKMKGTYDDQSKTPELSTENLKEN